MLRISTAILLEKFKPDYVINTGSAGGFHPELNVGDAGYFNRSSSS